MANMNIGTKLTIGQRSCDAEQAGAPALLEDGDDHAVGGADREHVHDRGLEGHEQRAEHDHQQQERQPDDRADEQRQAAGEAVATGR